MRLFRLSLATLALLVGAAPLAAQRDRDRDRRDRDYDFAIDTTVPLGRGATVDLTLVSGEIVVTAWARQEAKVSARIERGRIELDASSARLTLDARSDRGRVGEARYEVTVPTGTRVLMRAVSGDLSAHGVRGPVEAHAVSGDIVVEDALALQIESVSGNVRAARIAGDVDATSVSGEVALEDVTGDVRAESTSGDVSVVGARSRVVRLETVSGEVEFAGPLDRAGRYDFTSHSGDITLALPADVGAQLGLRTYSGEIESDFPLTLQPSDDDRRRRRQFDVTLGAGGARVTASTFSGNIDLERGTDRDKE